MDMFQISYVIILIDRGGDDCYNVAIDGTSERKTMFGFVHDFIKDAASSTGYRIKMLIDNSEGDLKYFDVSQQVFDMQFDPVYKFPIIGEHLFHIIFDEKGIVTGLSNARKEHCKAVYSFGSPRTVGSVLKIGNDYIEFTDFADQFAEGRLVYYNDYKMCNAAEIKRGTKISLSNNLRVYCLDWTKDESTFSRVDLDFVKRILSENVYWMVLLSLYSDSGDFDVMTITRNYKKDENERKGDLAKLHLSREQLTKPSTT
jgi:hypothetical protein